MLCEKCKQKMQQDLDRQGRLEWFCLNPDCETNLSCYDVEENTLPIE
jgi:hypothetical protein